MGEEVNASIPSGCLGTEDPDYRQSQDQAEGENPGLTSQDNDIASTGPTPGQIKAMNERYKNWMKGVEHSEATSSWMEPPALSLRITYSESLVSPSGDALPEPRWEKRRREGRELQRTTAEEHSQAADSVSSVPAGENTGGETDNEDASGGEANSGEVTPKPDSGDRMSIVTAGENTSGEPDNGEAPTGEALSGEATVALGPEAGGPLAATPSSGAISVPQSIVVAEVSARPVNPIVARSVTEGRVPARISKKGPITGGTKLKELVKDETPSIIAKGLTHCRRTHRNRAVITPVRKGPLLKIQMIEKGRRFGSRRPPHLTIEQWAREDNRWCNLTFEMWQNDLMKINDSDAPPVTHGVVVPPGNRMPGAPAASIADIASRRSSDNLRTAPHTNELEAELHD
jgi:hypothetical protein